jgi:hypothetical protein
MPPPPGTINTQPVIGNKANNDAAPGRTNVGALVALANSSNPSYTEGNEVLLSTDLTGNIRTIDKSTVAQGSTTSGQNGPIIQGATTTAAPTYTTGQTNPLSLTTAGALRVDNSANTQPVSGTVTSNAGTGTFTTADNQTLTDNAGFTDGTSKIFMGGYVLDEVAGTALTENDAAAARVDAKRAQVFVIEDETTRGRRATVTASNAVKVDGSASTQPVSGTVTANAGTGTFTTAGNKTNNNAAPGATNVGALVGLANASAPSYTEGNEVLLSTDLAGNLRTADKSVVAQASTTSGQTGQLIQGATTTSAPTYTTGQTNPLSLTTAGALRVDNSAVSQPVHLGDTPNLNAFGRLRVANPYSIFGSSVSKTDGALLWDTSLTGSATSTWLQNQSTVRLRCSTTNGDIAIRQTKEYFHYQPGHSFIIFMTGIMGALKTNVTQRIGYFDANNGLFWEQDGVNLKVAIRSFATGSPVTTYVNQSSWNLDKLDGTGTSGITLDMSKEQIFFIDFQWLGVGRVRMGFSINGVAYYCHQFLTANVGTDVWCSTGSLPCRYEIRNTGTAASNTDLYSVCASVQSEGGYNPLGIVRSVNSGITAKTVSTTLIPLLSLRLKTANNRCTIIPLGCSFHISNAADTHWQMILNPTLTGASFTSVGTNAISEYDVTASAISGGEVIASGYSINGDPSNLPLDSLLRINSNIAGTSDILSLAAIRVESVNSTVYSEISYKELY